VIIVIHDGKTRLIQTIRRRIIRREGGEEKRRDV
jgi:hypothetical protein